MSLTLHEVTKNISADSSSVVEFIAVCQIFRVPQAQLLTCRHRYRSVVNRHDQLRRTRIVPWNQGPLVASTNLTWWEKNGIGGGCQGDGSII